jgi:hypothetical protein
VNTVLERWLWLPYMFQVDGSRTNPQVVTRPSGLHLISGTKKLTSNILRSHLNTIQTIIDLFGCILYLISDFVVVQSPIT